MGQLGIEDQHRKQINAGYHADKFRQAYVKVGQEQLKTRFSKQFRAGKYNYQKYTLIRSI